MPTRPALTLLLPPVARLRQDERACAATGAALARADELPRSAPGRAARLKSWFDFGRGERAAAPLTRTLDAPGAADGKWLRADPAHVTAELTTARLMACGGLMVTSEERQAFERALRPLFGDAGFEFSAPHADRWYLRLARDAELPECAPPELALGSDLTGHLPQGVAGPRFRHLLNEAQMLLHEHPANLRRIERDALPVNSVWFWGGGELPGQVTTMYRTIASVDPVVEALARLARAAYTGARRWCELPAESGATLADLQDLDPATVLAEWIEPARDAALSGRLSRLEVALPDGRGFALERAHRWRFWRQARVLA